MSSWLSHLQAHRDGLPGSGAAHKVEQLRSAEPHALEDVDLCGYRAGRKKLCQTKLVVVGVGGWGTCMPSA